MGSFPDAQDQLTPLSLIRSGQISNSCEIVALVSCYNEEDQIKNDKTFPIITIWERSVAMEKRFLMRSSPNFVHSFPHPNDVSVKF